MKKSLFTLAVSLLFTVPSHAGVGTALKKSAEFVASSNFVAAATYGSSATPQHYSLAFLVNKDVYAITPKLIATVGMDVRAEFGFANALDDVGAVGGLKYVVKGPFALHLDYGRDLLNKNAGQSADRVYLGIGFSK